MNNAKQRWRMVILQVSIRIVGSMGYDPSGGKVLISRRGGRLASDCFGILCSPHFIKCGLGVGLSGHGCRGVRAC